jgi:hypothetical protein
MIYSTVLRLKAPSKAHNRKKNNITFNGIKNMDHKDALLEVVEKLRDFNINAIPNKALADYYQGWIDQLNKGKITHPKFIRWLSLQADYWIPKDRDFGNYIKGLIS